jgi:hypothetical protein
MIKTVKIRIIIRPPTLIQKAAGEELWRRLSGIDKNKPNNTACKNGKGVAT